MEAKFVQTVEFSLETATEHGGADPLRPIITFDEQHADEISVGPVRVHIVAGSEPSDLDGAQKAIVFLEQDMGVTERQKQEVDHLIGNSEKLEGPPQCEYRHGCHQRQERQDDCVAFDGNNCRIMNSFSGPHHGAYGKQRLVSVCERKEEPQNQDQNIDLKESIKNLF